MSSSTNRYYTSTNKKGEINELKEALNSTKNEIKIEALKKTIAFMTIGKDVSSLFQSVIKCLEINNIEIKKLVYLYIINYSRTKPDDAIMVINQFNKDAKNKSNAIIRALALRTMGCLKIAKLNEYLIDSLKETLSDSDPYVRKTAVLCASKFYELTPKLVEEKGIMTIMINHLKTENNSSVLTNLIIALQEMSLLNGKKLIEPNQGLLKKILTCVADSIEWGQIALLDYLSQYKPTDSKEAEHILDKILSRLSHANPGVVFSACKIIFRYIYLIENTEIQNGLIKKVNHSLGGIMAGEPELVFAILKNLDFLIQRHRNLFTDVKMFFCKYSDLPFVRNEKLNILLRLTDSKNADLVLSEFFEYSNDLDPEFSRKAIQCIWKIALQMESTVEKCLQLYVKMLKDYSSETAGHHICELAIGFSNIIRKHPQINKSSYEFIVQKIVDYIPIILESKAKVSAIWILGEFASMVKNVSEMLGHLYKDFLDDNLEVQLQILTSATKCYILHSEQEKIFDIILEILTKAANQCENPDLRDKAFIYWRMLFINEVKANPETMKKVLFPERPSAYFPSDDYSKPLLDKMIMNIGSVSSIFHEMPENLFPKEYEVRTQKGAGEVDSEDGEEFVKVTRKDLEVGAQGKDSRGASFVSKEVDLLDAVDKKSEISLIDLPQTQTPTRTEEKKENKPANQQINLLDIDLLGGNETHETSNGRKNSDNMFDVDLVPSSKKSKSIKVPFETLLKADMKGKKGVSGIVLECSVGRENSQSQMEIIVRNQQTNSTITDIKLILKGNIFNLDLQQPKEKVEIKPSGVHHFVLPLIKTQKSTSEPVKVPFSFTLGFQCNLDTFILNCPVFLHALMIEDAPCDKELFKTVWKQLEGSELRVESSIIEQLKSKTELEKKLFDNNINFVASRTSENSPNQFYFYCKSLIQTEYYIQVQIQKKEKTPATISCRSSDSNLGPAMLHSVSYLINQFQLS